MKVELELSAEQLKDLDTDLTKLLDSMTDEQKTEILKTYFLNQFQGMVKTIHSDYGYDRTEISDFGEAVLKGLKEKITDSISLEILESQDLKDLLDETIEDLKGNLSSIIEGAISKYVIEKLFFSQQELKQEVINQLYSLRGSNG